MESKRKIIRYPENLKVKAELVLAGVSITDMADELDQSRNWLNRVLNGHEKGTEVIELIYKKLKTIGYEKAV